MCHSIGNSYTKSGSSPSGWLQPASENRGGTGAGPAPSGAPASTQAVIVAISSALRLALAGYVKLYADRYARDGIRINNVLPGFMENWPMDDSVRASVPMARAGKFAEVAKTVAFLLSDDAGYITGQNILVDGGVNRAI